MGAVREGCCHLDRNIVEGAVFTLTRNRNDELHGVQVRIYRWRVDHLS